MVRGKVLSEWKLTWPVGYQRSEELDLEVLQIFKDHLATRLLRGMIRAQV